MRRPPLVKWAQRTDKVFITIELPGAKDVKLFLQSSGHLHFSAATGHDNVPHEIDIDLYDKVNVDESRACVGSWNITYIVKKAEEKWWSRLLKQEGNPPLFLQVDWKKWIGEYESAYNSKDMDIGASHFMKLNLGSAEDVEEYSEVEGKDDQAIKAKTVQILLTSEESGAVVDPNESKEAVHDDLSLDYVTGIAKERGASDEEISDLIWKLTEFKKGTSSVKNGEDVIDLLPSQVEFEVEMDRVSLSSIELTNKSNHTIKFKFNMKAYRMEKYRIFPYFGVLQPRATVLVRVGREPVIYNGDAGPNSCHLFATWKMLSSEDRLPLEITNGGEVVQTVSIRAFTPQPPGYAEYLQKVDNPPRDFWQQIVYQV